MTARTRKLVHAGAIALFGALSDLSLQLMSGQLINAQRTVIAGVLLGVFARTVGAILARLAFDEPVPVPESALVGGQPPPEPPAG